MVASARMKAKDNNPYLSSAIRKAHELAFKDIAEETIITPASAGNDGGLLGAAMLFRSAVSHIKKP